VGEQLRVLVPQGLVPAGNAARLAEVSGRLLADGGVPGEIVEPFTLEAMGRSTLEVYGELAGA
jgi:hypothetical protein